MAAFEVPVIDPDDLNKNINTINKKRPRKSVFTLKEKKVHRCPHEGCTSSFNRPYRLAQHLLVHNNIKAFACPEENCTKAYTNKSHLDRHISKTHNAVKEEELIFICPFETCLKKYSNRQNLKRHIRIKHKVVFKCDNCGEIFKKKHLLSSHMHSHTSVEPFSCDFCDKTFIRLCDKKKHIRYHKTHKCTECKMKFNYWSRLQKHMKNDHGREFICDHCGRKFKQRIHITRHLKSHDKSKFFNCPYENCKRFYTRNSNLKQHVMTYHENYRHVCHICNAMLTTKAKLQQHIVVIHEFPKTRIYKTKATGRKVRKDFGKVKKTTALKLAGLPLANSSSGTMEKPEQEPASSTPTADKQNPQPIEFVEVEIEIKQEIEED